MQFNRTGKRSLRPDCSGYHLPAANLKRQTFVGMRGMSALGQKQTFALQQVKSALPPKADIGAAQINVRFVPIADIPLFTDHLVAN